MSNTSIFKAYDIRGIYPDQLDGELAKKIGWAFGTAHQGKTLAIGRDMRLSGDEVFEGLSQGLQDYGVTVMNAGLISTDMLYFAVGRYGYDGGIMITASHNPSQYNGMKFCGPGASPISYESGIQQIEQMVADGGYPERLAETGVVRKIESLYEDWIIHALSFVDEASLKPFKIVVDAGNGMAGKVIPELQRRTNLDIAPLYFELDGNFPNHPANPIEPENVKDLQAKIKESGADIGLAFDGDADRVFLVDELGEIIDGTVTTAMVSQMMLRLNPGSTVLYNAICGNVVPETIADNGGKSVRTRVGHSFIKQDMRREGAIFAGEHSGHYYFRDNFFADSGLIAALTILQLMSQEEGSLSQIAERFAKYPRSGEINSHVEDIPKVLARIKETYAKGQLDELDGLTIRFSDWWFNLRASNTEPLLRLNVEANDQQILERETEKLLGIIRG